MQDARGIGCLIFIALVVVVSYLIYQDGLKDLVDLIPTYWPILGAAQVISVLVLIFILLPMTLFRKTFPWAMVSILFGAPAVFGLSLWLLSVVLVYVLFGGFWLICGVLSFGIGIVPLAFLAALFKGTWLNVGDLVYLAAFSYLPRLYVMWQANRLDMRVAAKREGMSEPPPSRTEID